MKNCYALQRHMRTTVTKSLCTLLHFAMHWWYNFSN